MEKRKENVVLCAKSKVPFDAEKLKDLMTRQNELKQEVSSVSGLLQGELELVDRSLKSVTSRIDAFDLLKVEAEEVEVNILEIRSRCNILVEEQTDQMAVERALLTNIEEVKKELWQVLGEVGKLTESRRREAFVDM